MPRLFVAVNLSSATITQLMNIQPRPAKGIRLTKPEQMHLTLHFLGEVNCADIRESLRNVTASGFSLRFDGVGKFTSADGSAILWVGVKRSPELMTLHGLVADVLSAQGIKFESRPYAPHITLARCKPDAPSAVVQEFLERHSSFSIPEVSVESIELYSSTLTANGPLYICEQSLPLMASGNRQVSDDDLDADCAPPNVFQGVFESDSISFASTF